MNASEFFEDWARQTQPMRDLVESVRGLIEQMDKEQFRNVQEVIKPLTRASLGIHMPTVGDILTDQVAEFCRSIASIEDLLPKPIEVPIPPIPDPVDERARLADLHAQLHAEAEEAAQEEARRQADEDDRPWPGMYL